MTESLGFPLLTVAQMASVDAATIAEGTPEIELMERAGAAVAAELARRFPDGAVVALCGPGNNGGDGLVAARLLAEQGRTVSVALLGDRARLSSSASLAAARWTGEVTALRPGSADGAAVVIDALFGAGLSRPIEGLAKTVLSTLGDSPVVAVDVPSGVDGDSGCDLGAAKATVTVTFGIRKPGHLLLPGKGLCGDVVVADIGLSQSAIRRCGSTLSENRPGLWLPSLPRLAESGHKYKRGHAVVLGGWPMSGAARLAARGAARAGAGLVTIAAPAEALTVYAAALSSIMVKPYGDEPSLHALFDDDRLNAALLGPGAGMGEQTRTRALFLLGLGRSIVLDADALTSFAAERDTLFQAIRGPTVMTPHDGEFARLFGDLAGDKVSRARAAARLSGAVIVLKGSDTVIAAPDGRAAINATGSGYLATGGTGDVLGGIVLGLLAQSVPDFEAACAAVWMHGVAGTDFGPGLMAEDLPDLLPKVLRDLGQ